MVFEEVKKKLISLITNLFNNNGLDVKNIENCDFIQDLGMDSHLFMALIVEIEETFSLNIPDELLLMENFNEFDKIVQIIATVIENGIYVNEG